MVAALQRKEEFNYLYDVGYTVYVHLASYTVHILSLFGFIYLKGASLIFTAFNDERTGF